MKLKSKFITTAILALWAIACFVFFNWYYPYHLVYREQTQLFLFSGDYISSYFQHPAWFGCLAGDFLTQFFYFVGGGATTLTISILLLGIIFYAALGKIRFDFSHRSNPSETLWITIKVLLTLVLMTWEALRNCGLDYGLSSTISLMGGLFLFLPYTLFPQRWRWIPGIVLLPLCYWLFGYGVWALLLFLAVYEIKSQRYLIPALFLLLTLTIPALVRQTYLLTWKQAYQYPTNAFVNKPNLLHEKILAMDVEGSFGHWDMVAKLSEKEDLQLNNTTYFYNLSHAMQGLLPVKLLDEYQPGTLGLLISLQPNTPWLSVWSSNEAWFQIGDMTMAEHATMLAMVFSPNHRSSRMVKRLAEINMINGDTEATLKYLRLLKKTWFYKVWAENRMPGRESTKILKWVDSKRKWLPKQDTIRSTNNIVLSLRSLVKNNPENRIALDYLLCYDLLSKDIKAFMTDYETNLNLDLDMPNRLYSEALLIGLAKRNTTPEESKRYHIFQEVYTDFDDYTRQYEQNGGNGEVLQSKYKRTYWFYYHFATFK